MHRFISHPDQALVLLKAKLRPATVPNQIHAWIGRLDDDDFTTRETATHDLKQAGVVGRQVLEKALCDSPSAETRRRISEILATLSAAPQPEELRSVCAVDILEQIGSREARISLERLERVLPNAPLTQAAKGVLLRMADGKPK